jgi:hypothetical protein
MLRGNAKGCWLKKGVTASSVERVELNEFQNKGCCGGMAGTTGVKYNAVKVVGVEDQQPNIGPVFNVTCGQLLTRLRNPLGDLHCEYHPHLDDNA